MNDHDERLELHFAFNISKHLMKDLDLTPGLIKDKMNEIFREYLTNRLEELEALKNCEPGGYLHTFNVLNATINWLVSNMIDKDRDATDFVLKQYVDSIFTLVLKDLPTIEQKLTIERLSDQALHLNDVCDSDASYFQNVKTITEVMTRETMNLISTTFEPGT